MSWESVADDVALNIVIARPFTQDPGGVNLLRTSLLGLTLLPGCPPEYQQQAAKLAEDYLQQARNPGQYVEWNEIAKETHLLLAKLGGCQDEAIGYYS